MALKNYNIIENGISYTVQLEEDTAKARGLTPVEEKAATVQNKRRQVKNKGAADAVPEPEINTK